MLKNVKSGDNARVHNENIIKNSIRNAGLILGTTNCETHWLAKMSIACFLITTVTQFLELIFAIEDTKKLFTCFSILSFCAMGLLKLYSLKQRHEQWFNLINQSKSLELEQLYNRHEFDIDLDYEETDDLFASHIASYTTKFQLTSILLRRIYSFTAIVFILAPFIEYGIYIYQDITVKSMPHILPGWSPLDGSLPGYVVTILTEITAALYCVTVHIAFDISVVGEIMFICGQFNLLHEYSVLIGGTGNNYELSEVRDTRALTRIKNCHHIHVILIKSIKELRMLIQNIMGIYFTVATLTLCSVAMQFNWEELSVTQLICLLQYMCGTLTQLYLYCHFGDALLNESAVSLGEGPFRAAFWCLSPKTRRELSLLCVGMSRQHRLYAGFTYSLDLPSFINVVRTAYSFYAVLRGISITD